MKPKSERKTQDVRQRMREMERKHSGSLEELGAADTLFPELL